MPYEKKEEFVAILPLFDIPLRSREEIEPILICFYAVYLLTHKFCVLCNMNAIQIHPLEWRYTHTHTRKSMRWQQKKENSNAMHKRKITHAESVFNANTPSKHIVIAIQCRSTATNNKPLLYYILAKFEPCKWIIICSRNYLWHFLAVDMEYPCESRYLRTDTQIYVPHINWMGMMIIIIQWKIMELIIAMLCVWKMPKKWQIILSLFSAAYCHL